MRVYVLTKDITTNLSGLTKKGTKFFYKKDSIGGIYTPETGGYPWWGDIVREKGLFKRTNDLPYNEQYWINKHRIKRIQQENKEIEAKYLKKKLSSKK